MIRWFRTLFVMVKEYYRHVSHVNTRLEILEKRLKDITEVDVDLCGHMRGTNTIIVVGRFRKHDFIQVYSLSGYDFESIVKILQDLRRQGHVNIIDGPIEMRAHVTRMIDI